MIDHLTSLEQNPQVDEKAKERMMKIIERTLDLEIERDRWIRKSAEVAEKGRVVLYDLDRRYRLHRQVVFSALAANIGLLLVAGGFMIQNNGTAAAAIVGSIATVVSVYIGFTGHRAAQDHAKLAETGREIERAYDRAKTKI